MTDAQGIWSLGVRRPGGIVWVTGLGCKRPGYQQVRHLYPQNRVILLCSASCFIFYYSHLSVFLWESDVGRGDSGAVARGWAGAWVGVEVSEEVSCWVLKNGMRTSRRSRPRSVKVA